MKLEILLLLLVVDMVVVRVFSFSARFLQRLLQTGRIYPSTEALLNILAMGFTLVAIVVVNICIMVHFGVK